MVRRKHYYLCLHDLKLLLFIKKGKTIWGFIFFLIFLLGLRRCLQAYPNGKNKDIKMSIYLLVSDFQTLSPGWKIQAKVCITIRNHSSQSLSIRKGNTNRFDLMVMKYLLI